MGIVERTEQRFFLVIAAELADRALVNEFAIKGVAVFEARWAHASGRADALSGFFRIGDNEWTVFAAEKACGVEGFEFLTFAEIEALTDIDECGNSGMPRPERSGNHGADMGRGDCLRRGIAGMPLILVAGMKNETEISGGVGADERGAIHHAGDIFEALSKFDVIDVRVDLRKGGEDLIGFETGFERGVAFGIESFGMGHAASHPQDDDGVSGWRDFFLCFAEDLARKAGAESGKGGCAGGFEKISTCHFSK